MQEDRLRTYLQAVMDRISDTKVRNQYAKEGEPET